MDNRHEKIISDAFIDTVWGNANFGDEPKRKVIADTLIKCMAGYKTGSTAAAICVELCLIYSNKWKLTALGQKYLGHYLLESVLNY